MWKPYLKLIAKRATNALNILDRFHIAQKLNEAIDKVRATETKALIKKGMDVVLKHSRWCVIDELAIFHQFSFGLNTLWIVRQRTEAENSKKFLKLGGKISPNPLSSHWVSFTPSRSAVSKPIYLSYGSFQALLTT
jgi:hypothetical protein